MNPKRRRLFGILRERFAPKLRAAGFKGSGTTFRRIVGDCIHCLEIEGRENEARLEIGVHLKFIPTTLGKTVNLKSLKVYDCEFRLVLGPPPGPFGWPYGENELEARLTSTKLEDEFENRAEPALKSFVTVPGPFASIRPSHIECGELPLPFDASYVRAALFLARMYQHLGRAAESREFAKIGLRIIGTGRPGSALVEPLKTLLENEP